MDLNLKPCPFCGKPITEIYANDSIAKLSCSCGARMTTGGYKNTPVRHLETLVNQWNTRNGCHIYHGMKMDIDGIEVTFLHDKGDSWEVILDEEDMHICWISDEDRLSEISHQISSELRNLGVVNE